MKEFFVYPNIDPVALSLGKLKIHWYGITYLAGFAGGWFLARLRAKKPNSGWSPDEIGDLVFYIALGVILGGRIGSIIFYNFSEFLANPLMLFKIWEGGMSFHGGFLGVLVAFYIYGRHTNRTFFQVADFLAPVFPLGLGAGRIGNFINGELWGRTTDVPWAMIYPHVDSQPRHPNQLYQFFFEGIVLLAILWIYSRKPRPTMAVSGLFGVAYGLYRFVIEFVREPDAHLGFVALDWLTMGQILSLPMIVIGAFLMWRAYRHPVMPPTSIPTTVQNMASHQSAATSNDAKTGNSNKARKSKSGKKKRGAKK